MNNLRWLMFLSWLGSFSCTTDWPSEVTEAFEDLPGKIDYNFHVKPILSDRCFVCHGNDQAKLKADLRLDRAESAYAELADNPGNHAIIPGNPDQSRLVYRILEDNPEMMMPPPESNLTLSPYEKAVLIRWIDEGAEYKDHWAFTKPQMPSIPSVKNTSYPRNDIDRFILARIEGVGLIPNPGAEKEKLLRRLSFDTRGLPPTREDVTQFVKDDSPGAYETWVDTYLASPHFGEHMAVPWLDAARYADSHGYQDDRPRTMWPWRDWVVDAFNENLPYDRFITWQIAGDLLPNATHEQKLATGFNRNHAITQEGGVVPEEYVTEYVADRTNTFSTAFLGLTMECARCHDHKYDPISTREYYSMFAFFNTLDEEGQINYFDQAPAPKMRLEDEELEATLDFLNKTIDDLESRKDQLISRQSTGFSNWMTSARNEIDWDYQLTQKLLGWYGFDDFQNLSSVNLVHGSPEARANTGLLTELAEPEVITGKVDKGLKFDGLNFLNLGDLGDFEYHDDFSLSAWIYPPHNLKTDAGLLVKRNGEQKRGGYELVLTTRFQLKASLVHDQNAEMLEVISDKSIGAGRWNHVALTYDGSGSASGIQLYLNGDRLNLKILKDSLARRSILNGNALLAGNWTPRKAVREDIHGFAKGAMDEVRVYGRKVSPVEVRRLAQSTSPPSRADWHEHYLWGVDNDFNLVQRKLDSARKEHFAIPEVMIMSDMADPRATYVLNRGAYDAPTEQVQPGTPAAVLPLPPDYPKNRLGLAKWLIHPDHPLTARVAVNRFWQGLFGRGLVKTAEDFGSQGDIPTHPALLDYLAIRFIESGWDVKALIKSILMSATYQQSARIAPEKYQQDPHNLLLARGPNLRLNAEMMRDHALAASGLLNDQVGGPWVKPFQPPGVWKELANQIGENKYRPSTGEDLYRRSLYTYWKRTIPPPAMLTFDAAERTVCVVKRQQTNTPLQALVLLNDPQFVESSRELAARMLEEGGTEVSSQIQFGFQWLTSREATEEELAVLIELNRSSTRRFENNPGAAEEFLEVGAAGLHPELDEVEHAAMTVVANILLNLDEAKMKS